MPLRWNLKILFVPSNGVSPLNNLKKFIKNMNIMIQHDRITDPINFVNPEPLT